MSEEIVWQALLNALTHAGLEYKSIHRAVTVFFVTRDCGADSESLADVTLDRVAHKIYKGEDVRNLVAYSKKFADRVWKEYCRDRDRFRKAMTEWLLHVHHKYESEENIDLRRECQKKCLKRLPESERKLLVDYYLTATDRERLAAELGLVIATLRTNIHRLKKQLRKCVEVCRRNA